VLQSAPLPGMPPQARSSELAQLHARGSDCRDRNERTLPDVLSFDPSRPEKYPNGRVFTDDVINYRLAFLTKNQCPPTGLKPHTDILNEFPYIGTPHSKKLAVG
jgi:hypothetical protein